MKNNRSSIVRKRITAFTLALLMVAGIFIGMPIKAEAADEVLRTEAVITKELTIPEGITAPDVTFDFTVTKKGLENGTGGLDTPPNIPANFPTFSIPSISFGSGDIGGTGNKIEKSVGFMDIVKGVTYPHAGVYYYTVTEDAISGTNAGLITNSQAVYTVRVYVKNKTSGGTEVSGITVEQNKNDIGTDTNVKVNPTPATGQDHAAFRFVNVYNENTQIKVEKSTVGDYADMTRKFAFTIEVKTPASSPATEVKYQVNSGGSVESATVTNNVATIEVDLANGEYVTLTEVPVGSKYTVKETVITGYTPTAVVTGNGDSGTAAGNISGNTYTVTLGTGTGAITELLVAKETDATKNTTVITNKYYTPSITGVVIDNLPFIMLIVIAAAGLVFFVASKRRRRSQ